MSVISSCAVTLLPLAAYGFRASLAGQKIFDKPTLKGIEG